MAALGLLVAFYLSLSRPWRLRYRMLAAWAIGVVCAVGLECAKRLACTEQVNWAGLGEHVVATGAGALLFALVWDVLDRRGGAAGDMAGCYGGPERRRNGDGLN